MAVSEELRIIIKAEVNKAVSGMKKATGTMSAMQKQANENRKTFAKLKQSWTGTAGAVIAFGFAVKGVVGVVKDFEQGIANVKAISTATTEELSNMAREAGKGTVFSAREAADALYFLASAGIASANSMKDVLMPALNLAAAGNIGIAEATDLVIGQLKVFNMETAEAGNVTDILAKTVSSANTDMQQLGTALSFSASTAKLAGVSFKDLNVLLGVMANQGVKSSRAGTQLRQALVRLIKPTSGAQKILNKYGLTTAKISKLMPTPIELFKEMNEAGMSQAEMLEILGVRQGDVIKLIKEGGPEMEKMARALNKVQGEAKRVADIRMDTLEGSLKLLKSAWDEMLISMMTGSPSVMDGFKGIVQLITKAVSAFNSLPGPIKSVVGIITTLTAASLVLTKVVMGFGVGFKTAFAPIAIGAAAIGVIITVMTAMKGKWTLAGLTIRLVAEKIWTAIKKMALIVKIEMLGMAKKAVDVAKGIAKSYRDTFNAVNINLKKLGINKSKLDSAAAKSSESSIARQIAADKRRLKQLRKGSRAEASLRKQIAEERKAIDEAEAEAARQDQEEKLQSATDHERNKNEKVKSIKREADAEEEENRQDKKSQKQLLREEELAEESDHARLIIDINNALNNQLMQSDLIKIKAAVTKYQKFTQAFNQYSSFMMSSLDKKNKAEFAVYKAFAISQATIQTINAAVAGYAAMSMIPIVGPTVLAPLAMAAAYAMGARNIAKIAAEQPPKAFMGGIVPGSPAGTTVTVGERNQAEAIIPLGSEEGGEALATTGGGAQNIINVNVEFMFSDDESMPMVIAERIDKAMFDLKRNDRSVFAEALT
jgi:TP901 family phage tail tape measure protein